MKRFFLCSLCFHLLNVLTIFPRLGDAQNVSMSSDFSFNSGGYGKREAHIISWYMVKHAKAAPVTRTTLRTTGPALAESRQ